MTFEIRPPTADELVPMFTADARSFGMQYTLQEMEDRRPALELDRFRLAFEDGRIVGTSGAYSLELTMPGGTFVPVAGITWVGTQPTHRRRGIMRQMLDALHQDALDRGDVGALLLASESGIYGRFGYGRTTQMRSIAITKHEAVFRPEAPGAGRVWFADDPDEARDHDERIYEAYRRLQPGEVSRSAGSWTTMFTLRSKPLGALSPVFHLLHDDGFCMYRVAENWGAGHPSHTIEVVDLVALTDDARGALWRTLLSIDLVGEVRQRFHQLEDPLQYWLESPRAVRTVAWDDHLWLKPLEPSVLLGARAYGTPDRLVIEVDGVRWAVDNTGDEVDARKVRSRPDLVVSEAGLGSLLLGGVRASVLARGRYASGDEAALRRADLFFLGDRAPASQTMF